MSQDDAATVAARAERAQDPVDGLQAVAELRAMLDDLERRQVGRALGRGFSWAQVGRTLGISKQAAHRRHAGRAAPGDPPDAPAPASGDADERVVITGTARAAVARARELAIELGDQDVRADHLVAALLELPTGTAREALLATGVEPEDVLALLRASTGERVARRRRFARAPQVSSPLRAVLERSLGESQRLCHGHLGPEHLLLALLRDDDGPAVGLLTHLGASPQDISDAVCDVLKHTDFARSL